MRRCAHFLTFRLFVGVSVLTSRVGCGGDAAAAPKGVATAAMGRGALRVSWRCASTSGNSSSGNRSSGISSSGGGGIRGNGKKSAQLWTMQSSVRDVLLQGVQSPGELWLKTFVKDHLDMDLLETTPNPTMEAFLENPLDYIDDNELYNLIVSLPSYKLLKAAQHLEETARHLESLGIIDLQQWKEYAQKDTLLISAHAKGLLDGALAAVSQVLPQGQLVKHYYDTVSSAQWHYIEMDPNSGGLGMRVKEGLPAELWSDAEVNNYQEYEGQKVEGEPYIEAPQVSLMVLSSKEGWPYTFFEKKVKKDCFVRREMVRVWRIIQKDITKWIKGGCTPRSATQRILIGTPGIGKSFGGSYLLYELLRCDVQAVSVVAYFVHGDFYVFDRTSNPPNVHYFDEEAEAVRFVKLMQKRCNGYIIYDVFQKKRNPSMALEPSWCSLVISPPNEKNFSEWEKQRVAVRTIINCPTTVELKAMCAWMKRETDSETAVPFWHEVNKAAEEVGPLPRYVFNAAWMDRQRTVENELQCVKGDKAELCFGVSKEVWVEKNPCHKLVKMVRVTTCDSQRSDDFRNAPLSIKLKSALLVRVADRFKNNEFLKTMLFNANYAMAVALERYSILAFLNLDFVTSLKDSLKQLKKEGDENTDEEENTQKNRKCLLQENKHAYPKKGVDTLPVKTEIRLNPPKPEYGMLYIPSFKNLPVVDALFFAQTTNKETVLVGLKATTADNHHTKASTVLQFMDYLSYFEGWEEFSKNMVWEIIYVQDAGSQDIKKWQKCAEVPGEDPEGDLTAAKDFWDKRVYQYHLKIGEKQRDALMNKDKCTSFRSSSYALNCGEAS